MFGWLTKPLIILILCLGVWLGYQSHQISNLRATNQAQAQIIKQQQLTNQQLSNQLEEERQAIERQQQITNQIRKESEGKREKVKLILEHEDAAKTLLPNSVLEQLQ